MEEDMEQEEGVVAIATKKVNLVGRTIYGEKFERYAKVGEISDLIATFKEYYYEEKVKNFQTTSTEIIRNFNRDVAFPIGRTFFPYTSQYKGWRAKWDRDILESRKVGGLEVLDQKQVLQVIKTRNEDNELILGAADDSSLEAGVRTLGGELLNDAFQILREDQALEEIYTQEELMRRRNYIVNVFSHTTKLVHGKAALMLKASQEKRENASFLMTFLSKATAGKLSETEVGILKTAYIPEKNEQPAQL